MFSSWYLLENLHLHLHLGYPQPRGLRRQQKQEHFECPSLWERRARNKKSMILKGKQAKSYKTNNGKRKLRQIKTKTYRRQGMLKVEVTSS
jgi:hypothetical protein